MPKINYMANYKDRDFVVVSYDLEGHYLVTYTSARSAAISLGIFPRSIEKCIREESSTINNKMWRRYQINEEIPLLIPP